MNASNPKIIGLERKGRSGQLQKIIKLKIKN